MDITLVDAVAELRDELLAAAARGAGEQVAFVVGTVELEFSVELKADARAKAGFRAWVVSADAEGGLSRADTHKVKVTLHPRGPDGGDLLIADSRSLAGRADGSPAGRAEGSPASRAGEAPAGRAGEAPAGPVEGSLAGRAGGSAHQGR